MAHPLTLRSDPPLGEIVLARPERRNALNLAMWKAVPALVEAANADARVRVILLHGGGCGVFAAGADISEFEAVYGTQDAARRTGQIIAAALKALEDSTKPVIAAIEGACVGGGVSLAAACDLRVAHSGASFGVTPAKLGLVYPPGDVRRLLQLIGPGAAKDLLLTGRLIPAAEAKAIGLIDRVTEEPVLQAARDLAAEIASVSQWSVRAVKKMIRGLQAGWREDGPEAEALFLEGFANPDFAEGVRAFLDKRPADWKVK
ncbi:MAG: enoyl-CoA hydratase/isomerase family protein [Hyphomonas sp.]